MSSDDKEFWREFIELYRELPALWRVKSAEYSKRAIKDKCYVKLVSKLKEKIPDANREYAVKKINNLRTAYRKELKKVKQRENSGEAYEPYLWYFPLLSFLQEQEEFNPASSTMDDDGIEEKPRTRRKKKKLSEEDNFLKFETLQLQNERHVDSDDMLAKTWANQLMEMEPRQRVIAQKLISDVIFHGCMGNLDTAHATELPNFLQLNVSRSQSVLSGLSPPSNSPKINQVYCPTATLNVPPDDTETTATISFDCRIKKIKKIKKT